MKPSWSHISFERYCEQGKSTIKELPGDEFPGPDDPNDRNYPRGYFAGDSMVNESLAVPSRTSGGRLPRSQTSVGPFELSDDPFHFAVVVTTLRFHNRRDWVACCRCHKPLWRIIIYYDYQLLQTKWSIRGRSWARHGQ